MSSKAREASARVGAQDLAAMESAASEFEIALVVIGHSFGHWVERCAAAAGIEGLTTMDLLVLHYLRVRQRELKAGDIAFALSIESTHLVTYSLRKLLKLGQLAARKSGKETLFSAAPAAEAPFQAYSKVRRDCLVASLASMKNGEDLLRDVGEQLTRLAGIYEQAARSAALAT